MPEIEPGASAPAATVTEERLARIHPTSIVEAGAELGEGAVIGPWCTVGPEAVLRDRVVLVSHVAVAGRTTIGQDTSVYPFASLGMPPQDLKYRGEASRLEIGAGNTIREHVTMNPGTEGGGMVTRVGDNGLFMVGAHVAHDCEVGNHVVFANNASIAGHVTVGDHAIIGGLATVHQFCRIGAHAIIGLNSAVVGDVIPFGSASGDRARMTGLNVVGLQRRDFSRSDIHALRTAYRLLFAKEGTLSERLEDVARMFAENAPVMEIVSFVGADSARPICQPWQGGAA